jgi:hypothetical protein
MPKKQERKPERKQRVTKRAAPAPSAPAPKEVSAEASSGADETPGIRTPDAPLPHKIEQPHGGALNSGGTPGHKPGRGRPPNAFKRAMRAIASHDETLEYLKQCAAGLHGASAAIQAQQYAAERGYGKVTQGVDGRVEFVVRFVDE